ncbi:uncharacterized protein Dvar_11350 [Desulfosarcina variabilis str. Montpellier]
MPKNVKGFPEILFQPALVPLYRMCYLGADCWSMSGWLFIIINNYRLLYAFLLSIDNPPGQQSIGSGMIKRRGQRSNRTHHESLKISYCFTRCEVFHI